MTFIKKLLSGATQSVEDYTRDQYGNRVEELPPTGATFTADIPMYARARSLVQTALERLENRQVVLMKEIAVRQGELFETNKTLEALTVAATAIHDEHEPEIDEDALARALSEGDAGVYENPIVSMTEEEYVDYRAKATSLLREATAAPITADTPFPSGAFKPRGFA